MQPGPVAQEPQYCRTLMPLPLLLLLGGQWGLGCRKNTGFHSCLPLATV